MPTWDTSWKLTPLNIERGWWVMTMPCLYRGRGFSVHESDLPFEEVQRLLLLHKQARLPLTLVAPDHLPMPVPFDLTSEEAQMCKNERKQHLNEAYNRALDIHMETLRESGRCTQEQLNQRRTYEFGQFNLLMSGQIPMELSPWDTSTGWWFMHSETVLFGRAFAVHESMLNPKTLENVLVHYKVMRAPIMFMHPYYQQRAPISPVARWTVEMDRRLKDSLAYQPKVTSDCPPPKWMVDLAEEGWNDFIMHIELCYPEYELAT
jgi:hypothetical protein